MRLAVSALGFGGHIPAAAIEAICGAGISGAEIAPTAIWAGAPDVEAEKVRIERERLEAAGLQISGIQSLLFGQPDLQLLDPASWPKLLSHLERMLEIAAGLGTRVAVFGSPRNRVRGALLQAEALEIAAEFFWQLEPALTAARVSLTLEPNAPQYGCDFLTTYDEVLQLADQIASPVIQAQVDTGCLSMAGADPISALRKRTPHHVHISAVDLKCPPDQQNFAAYAATLRAINYEGWVVLEMLPSAHDPVGSAVAAARWFGRTFGGGRD